MFPIRCYTCNLTLAHLHPRYSHGLVSGEAPKDMFEELGIHRMCCRRMFIGFVDLTSRQKDFGNFDVSLDSGGTVLKRFCDKERTVSCD